MKHILSIIGIITILLMSISFTQKGCTNTVTQEEFEEKHNYLNNRIDTIQEKLNELNFIVSRIDTNVSSLQADVDTLKAGQIIIYDELTNFTSEPDAEENWANKLIEWLD